MTNKRRTRPPGRRFIGRLLQLIFAAAGILCLLYFCAVTRFIGYLNVFNLFWVFLGLCCLALAALGRKLSGRFKKLPRPIRVLGIAAAALLASSFIVIETLVIAGSKTADTQAPRWVIVLGAGLNKSKPSLTLRRRITAAAAFLAQENGARAVVSGGKGAHERVTEASVMAALLEETGIESGRILLEDRSRSTRENLLCSAALINPAEKIIIVSSDFHLFRAKMLAKKLGYRDVGVLASKTPSLLLPGYYVREYFAVVKDLAFR